MVSLQGIMMKYFEIEKISAKIEDALIHGRTMDDNDETLLANLQDIIQQQGNIACRLILQSMVNVDLDSEKAMACWLKVLDHRLSMTSALGRQVRLLPAFCDFFSSQADCPHDMKLVGSESYEQVVNDTIHDSLTGIYNRNYFSQALEQQFSLAQRYDTDLTILFMDVDDFKDVNDTFGHQAGDMALQSIARVISQEKRESDLLARFGGEEFVLLMPHTGNINGFILAERIRQRVAELQIDSNGLTFSVTISGGIASFPGNGNSPDQLLRRADSALYQAKGAGKDTIAQYKMDKRRYLRVKFCQEIKVRELGFHDSEQFYGMTKDICSGGILFKNNKELAIGLRIQMSIPIHQDEPLILIGTVVRVEAYSENNFDIGMAISFKEMEKIANHEISDYLKRERILE